MVRRPPVASPLFQRYARVLLLAIALLAITALLAVGGGRAAAEDDDPEASQPVVAPADEEVPEVPEVPEVSESPEAVPWQGPAPGDPEAAAGPAPMIAAVSVDPEGTATRHLAAVLERMKSADPVDAFDPLVTLFEDFPEVLLPVPFPERGDAHLARPAREIVERLWARLPAEVRALAEARWGPAAVARERRAALRDAASLARLGEDFAITAAGRRALLDLADLDLEAGRPEAASRRLARLLALVPLDAPPAERVPLIVRLADARASMGDRSGVLDLARRYPGVLRERVRVAGRDVAAGARIAENLAVAAARGGAPPPGTAAVPVAEPATAWTASLADAGLLDEPADTRPVTTGVYATADELVLHAGRSVFGLDPLTGLVRWRFPAAGPRGWDFAPWVRFERYDVPARTVTPAGDLRLVVMGSPPGTGDFRWLDEPQSMDREAQESRTRLVALDAATGTLRWATGLPTATHEILGDPATGCVSPPLVSGEDVYALFARRRGVAEIYLACLARADGAVRWVTFLGAGESGLSASTAERERFESIRARAVPWGARPAISGDEILALPHAGFAAGVEAGTGALRWLRALPRHDPDLAPDVLYAFSVRNEPVRYGGSWIVAPLDAPDVLSLECGTGRLRWAFSAADVGRQLRDLLGVVAGPGGQSRILFAGSAAVTTDPANPLHAPKAGPEAADLGGVAGRAMEAAGAVLRLEDGVVWRLRPDLAEDDVPREAVVVLPYAAPADGDVHRLTEGWLVLDDALAAVVGPRGDLLARARQAAAGDDPRRALVARAVVGRLVGGGSVLADAVREAIEFGDAKAGDAAFGDAAVRDAVAGQVLLFLDECLERSDDEIAAMRGQIDPVIPLLVRLPPGRRGAACAQAYLLLRSLGDGEAVVEHLDRWIAEPPVDLIPWGGANVREDLVAGNFLAGLRGEASARAALEARERRHERAVAAALAAPEPELSEAIRRAARTSAADAGRTAWMARLTAAGRFTDAAAVAADLRLDPAPAVVEGDLVALRRRGVDLLVREASWVARGGEPERARALLATVAHGIAGDAEDDEGTSAADLAERLRRAHGWSPQPGPERTLDLWPEGAPKDVDERRSIGIPSLVGPGAAVPRTRFLLARGIHLEVWDAETGVLEAHLSAEDEGWFGASLREAESWVPGGGILVTSLVARQPGDLAGTRPGDWVLAWDGDPVSGIADFMNRVSRVPPGRETNVRVVRRGAEVLSSIRAGRRPAGDGRLSMDREQIHVEADGRLLVPTRTGILRVDLASGAGTWVWRWKEPGVVRSMRVTGGDAILAIDRGAEQDLLVSVDVARGTLRWRRDLPGSARWVEVDGSAVVVRCVVPGVAVVLDRRDGRPRLEVSVHERRYMPYRRTVPAAETLAACSGRVWSVMPAGFTAQVAVRNGTTGALEWSSGYPPDTDAPERGWVEPSLDADGVVAAITGRNAVRILVPDPCGGVPLHDLPLAEDVMTRQAHYGPVDDESRVLVGGTTLFLLRNTGGRTRDGDGLYDPGASVVLMGLDWAHLPPRTTGEAPPGGAVLLLSHQRMMTGGGRRSPWVLRAEPSPEGLLVFGGLFQDPPDLDRPECVWVPSFADEPEGAPSRLAALFYVRFAEEELTDLRFQAPARVGSRLFVPTDRGARVLQVLRMGE